MLLDDVYEAERVVVIASQEEFRHMVKYDIGYNGDADAMLADLNLAVGMARSSVKKKPPDDWE